MKKGLDQLKLLRLMSEFCEKLGLSGDTPRNMPIEDFGEWRKHNQDEAVQLAEMYLESYGSECKVQKSNSRTNVDEFVEESRFSRDEAIDVLKQEISKRESAGRPSKVEKWEKKIENNGASLSDAKEELSRSTWYKLKKRVEQ